MSDYSEYSEYSDAPNDTFDYIASNRRTEMTSAKSKTDNGPADPYIYIISQEESKNGKEVSSFQYKMKRSSKKSPESFTIKNLPKLAELKKGQLYTVAIRYDGNYLTCVAHSLIPTKATITITRETEGGSIVLDKMTNQNGEINHLNFINNKIDSFYPIPKAGVVLRILMPGTEQSAFESIESLLVEGFPEMIKVNVSKPEINYTNSIVFQQVISVPRRLPPTYPYYYFEEGKVTEIDGSNRYITKAFPETAKNSPSILICQVNKSFQVDILTSLAFTGAEHIILDCVNKRLQPRTIDTFRFENWNIKRTNPKNSTSFTGEQVLPGMVFVKLVKKNVDGIIQIIDTLYPGPDVQDVKVRLAFLRPAGNYDLINTLPVPDTKILPEYSPKKSRSLKSPRKHKSHMEVKKKPAKKEKRSKSPRKSNSQPKPKPVVEEYYYYSDEDEPAPSPNLKIYVDENGNIIDNSGAPKKDKTISDILRKIKKSGATPKILSK
ncbi:hypothetical protein TVAG_382180 [Trichomonas vaginalis G3]|uniref:Uncharacterized protein n=1 Tax=Trichomonas vaginalis (strain ATCC PRA-98 / G3) TaxID=412133 RepID=A2FND7_TRIV3|nr:hypothetical protein TVAGG3_0035340 [Trichomonas vaginalis G3]EAX93573.1 hypothetical protein TVAG_382180 [Trichomonas vaginalis G3]KAI5540339.1 hypothetical protein TVAGG3_0035340 [Trichomonas vaginalis G3]|eukprot:XP_001306503.1 hypothetical protein [Trichomonas vaginalis G3]